MGHRLQQQVQGVAVGDDQQPVEPPDPAVACDHPQLVGDEDRAQHLGVVGKGVGVLGLPPARLVIRQFAVDDHPVRVPVTGPGAEDDVGEPRDAALLAAAAAHHDRFAVVEEPGQVTRQQAAEPGRATDVDDARLLARIAVEGVAPERVDVDHPGRQRGGHRIPDEVRRAGAVHDDLVTLGELADGLGATSIDDGGPLLGASPGSVAARDLAAGLAQELDHEATDRAVRADHADPSATDCVMQSNSSTTARHPSNDPKAHHERAPHAPASRSEATLS